MSFEIINKSSEERPARFIHQPVEWRKMSQLEKDRYRDREKKRWLEGHEGLTGKHYYHLTRGHIKYGVGGTTMRPMWREFDEFLFQAIDEAEKKKEDLYVIKRREYGYTTIFGGCLPNYYVSTEIGALVGVTSCTPKRTANLFQDKLLMFYDHIDDEFELEDGEAPVFKPIEERRNETATNSYLKVMGRKNGVLQKSQIICPETILDPKAFSSYRLRYILIDEFALHTKVDEVQRSANDSLAQGGVKRGFMAIGGTTESEITHESLKRIQNLLSLKPEQLKAAKKSVIFIPAWAGRQFYEGDDGEELCIPGTRNGYDNERFATEVILKRRDQYIAAGDEEGLNAYIKNHPLTIDEVISAVGTGTLPSDLAEKVSRQKRYVLKERPPVFGYDLKEDQDGRIVATENSKSPIIIYKMPDPSAPKGTYICGNDPIPYGNNLIGDGSMDSFVIKNIHTQEYVAYYMERNLDPNYVNYKKVLLQKFYGDAKSMLEQNRGEVSYRYYVDNGYLSLLARKPTHLGLKTKEKQIFYGVFRNDPRLIDLGNSLFYEYIRNHIDKFMFEVGLDQMLAFDPKKINNDMIDSIIWLEVYQEELRRKAKKLSNQEDTETLTIPVRKFVNGKLMVVQQTFNVKKS